MSKPVASAVLKKKPSVSSWLLPLCCRLLTVANVAVPPAVSGAIDVSGMVAVLEDVIEEKVSDLVIRNPEAVQVVAGVVSAASTAAVIADVVDDVSGASASVIAAAQVVMSVSEEVTKVANEILPPASGAPGPSPSPNTVVAEPKSQA